jgi:hypothetical protein
MSFAESIRGFWDDLFYSSLVDRLETDLLNARMDTQQLRQDKDSVIADLRAEKSLLYAKVMLYEQNINARVGIDPTRKNPEKPSFASFSSPPMLTSWQKQVLEHEAELAKEEEAETAAKKGTANG